LTLERLTHVAGQPVQRVGISATVRPIETIARLLVGAGPDRDNPDGTPRCAIVDTGHSRRLDLALELPDDELGAVPTTEQMAQILDMIAGHVTGHRTTLVFVNTRSMAERVAHQLGERLGAACATGGSTPWSCRNGRWTSWPSRWWPSRPPKRGSRTSCSAWPGGRRRSATCPTRTSRTSPTCCPRASAPAAAAAPTTCTGT